MTGSPGRAPAKQDAKRGRPSAWEVWPISDVGTRRFRRWLLRRDAAHDRAGAEHRTKTAETRVAACPTREAGALHSPPGKHSALQVPQ